jgi:hypothetical protein
MAFVPIEPVAPKIATRRRMPAPSAPILAGADFCDGARIAEPDGIIHLKARGIRKPMIIRAPAPRLKRIYTVFIKLLLRVFFFS